MRVDGLIGIVPGDPELIEPALMLDPIFGECALTRRPIVIEFAFVDEISGDLPFAAGKSYSRNLPSNQLPTSLMSALSMI